MMLLTSPHTPDRKKKSRLFHVNGIKSWHTESVAIMSVRLCEEDHVWNTQNPDVLPFEVQREELQQLLQKHRANSLQATQK